MLPRHINTPPIFFSEYNCNWETEHLHLSFRYGKRHQKHLSSKTQVGLTIIFGNLIIRIIFFGSGKDPSGRQTFNGLRKHPLFRPLKILPLRYNPWCSYDYTPVSSSPEEFYPQACRFFCICHFPAHLDVGSRPQCLALIKTIKLKE